MKFGPISSRFALLSFLLLLPSCVEVRAPQNEAGVGGEGIQQSKLTANNAFFPLAVGNRWKYRCSVEGEEQFEKTLEIVSRTTKNGVTYYKAKRETLDNPMVVWSSTFTRMEMGAFTKYSILAPEMTIWLPPEK